MTCKNRLDRCFMAPDLELRKITSFVPEFTFWNLELFSKTHESISAQDRMTNVSGKTTNNLMAALPGIPATEQPSRMMPGTERTGWPRVRHGSRRTRRKTRSSGPCRGTKAF